MAGADHFSLTGRKLTAKPFGFPPQGRFSETKLESLRPANVFNMVFGLAYGLEHVPERLAFPLFLREANEEDENTYPVA